MTEKKEEIDRATKEKLKPKQFVKIHINGTTFTLTLTGADQAGYSSGSIAMTTPSMGGIKINQASGGTGIDRYDDMMPTAWEETNGTSLGTGSQTVAGVGTSMNVEWSAPGDMLPDGMSLQLSLIHI